MNYVKNWACILFAAAVYLFLYLPILVTVLFSFNASRIPALPIKAFTFDWYVKLFQEPKLWLAAKNSLTVSIPAMLLAILVGTTAAFLFQRYKFAGRSFLQLSLLLPYILPGIITGIALTLFFKTLQLSASLFAVTLGHVVIVTPVVMIMVMDRLKRLDKNLELASMDLGASPLKTFFYVTLPNIKGALLGGALLGLTVSFDEIVVTFFLIGTDNTLPMQIWSMIRYGYSPQINAIYSLFIVFSLAVIAFAGKNVLKKS